MDVKIETRQFLNEKLIKQEVSDDTPLISGGLIDSIEVVQLIAFLEDKFQIELDPRTANRHELDTIQKITTNYVPCLLEAGSPDLLPSGAFIGDAASYLIKNLQPGIYDFYLCGEREMIRGVTLLVDEHFAGSHVYTEVYY